MFWIFVGRSDDNFQASIFAQSMIYINNSLSLLILQLYLNSKMRYNLFYVICLRDRVRLHCACVLQCGTLDVLQGSVCDSSWKIVEFSFLFTTWRVYKAVTKRNCFAEEVSWWWKSDIITSHSEKLISYSRRHCPTRREWKMDNDSTAQKSKNQKNSGSTTGSAGANKDGRTHKNCDENTNSNKNSEKEMAGKIYENKQGWLHSIGIYLPIFRKARPSFLRV